MRHKSAWIAVVLLVAASSFGPWTPAAEGCARTQCELVTSCFQCDFLILLILECDVQLCNFCVNDFCEGEGPSGLVEGSEQALHASSCSSAETLEPPPVRVLEVQWQEDRT